jgi:prolyl oligopeptidase
MPQTRPVTRKVDVVDDFHGTKVPDPYRWLEEADTDEVRAWTEEQNARTRAWLDRTAAPRLRARIRQMLEIGFCAAPAIRTTKSGVRRYFHTRREGGQNQPLLYVRDGHDGADRVLVDPSTLSADGTTALDWWFPSWDGALLAWGKSDGGSEESTLYLRDVETGKDLALAIPHTQHASLAWLKDGSGFYYSRYPAPGDVPEGDEKYYCKLFLHRLGTDPKDDAYVFGDGRDKTDIPSVYLSPGGRWLVARVHMGWDRSELFVRDAALGLSAPWMPVPFATGRHAIFEPIPRDERLYVLTNDEASRYRLLAIDWDDLEQVVARPAGAAGADHVRTIIAEGRDVIEDVAIVGDTVFAAYLHDASTRIERFTKDGQKLGPIPLPGLGSASITGAWDGDEAFVNYTSFVTPFEVSRYDVKTGALSPWDRVRGSHAGDVEVTLLYATSKDGTRVPMFVVGAPGALAKKDNPVVLYGYGGFNVNQTPAFSARALLAVERGGLWVAAVLRGGGELGEDWHRAGMREHKQNVFDDFIACAEELVRRGITRPDRLCIMGGSNGGLLVAAAAIQRPELFAAGLSLVPLTDMLRYHRFRIGKLWIPEYGCADVAADFPFLYAYSPYHHVDAARAYPAMLFATADSDSRVDPMHARKMAARMQETQTSDARPILLRVESKAGHGQGKPVSKLVDELADEAIFAFRAIGIPLD